MIFGGIYLALAIFAAAVGGPADPGGLGLSPYRHGGSAAGLPGC